MAATISDAVFDAALQFIETNGGTVHILSAAAVSWANVGTYTLGNKAGCTYTGPSDGATGRKTILDAITGGTVTATGTASHLVITNGTDAIYVCQELDATQVVTSGNTFTLTAQTITIPDPTA